MSLRLVVVCRVHRRHRGGCAKAGTKAVGAVVDDAAVTPRYAVGIQPARELPIIWKIEAV